MYIVMGGIRNIGLSDSILTSTEIYDTGVDRWEDGALLPGPSEGLRAAKIDDRILIFGRNIFLYLKGIGA